MPGGHPTRVLVVTDKADPSPALTAAIRERAEAGEVRVRLVVLNPARAELHLLHPERHDKAFEAERVLLDAMPEIEQAAGGRVIGSVSVRHDPMDAVEETIFSEPVDEIILSVPPHGMSTRLHQDLPHRLQHFGIPISVVPKGPGA
jgi:hypothetical protein